METVVIGEHERVGQPYVDQDRHRDQQHERGPKDVGHDEDLLLVPAVNECARERREQEVRDRAHEEGERDGDRRVGHLVHEGG